VNHSTTGQSLRMCFLALTGPTGPSVIQVPCLHVLPEGITWSWRAQKILPGSEACELRGGPAVVHALVPGKRAPSAPSPLEPPTNLR
jgi:hypothetical protein